MCIHCSLHKQKCRLKSTTTNGRRHFGQSEQRKSSILFPIQSEKSPDSGFFTCDPTKKCIMPSSRERHKGKIGRGHDLRLGTRGHQLLLYCTALPLFGRGSLKFDSWKQPIDVCILGDSLQGIWLYFYMQPTYLAPLEFLSTDAIFLTLLPCSKRPAMSSMFWTTSSASPSIKLQKNKIFEWNWE